MAQHVQQAATQRGTHRAKPRLGLYRHRAALPCGVAMLSPRAWLQAADKMYEIDSGNKMTLYT